MSDSPARAAVEGPSRCPTDGSHGRAGALRFLRRDPVLHAKVIGIVEDGSGRVVTAGAHGTVVFHVPTRTWFIDTVDVASGTKLVDVLDGVRECEVTPVPLAEHLARRSALQIREHYVSAVAESGRTRPHTPVPPSVRLRRVPPRDAVLAEYPQEGRDHARARAASGDLWAGRDEEGPIGFVGVHGDGSIGLLHVPAARRRHGWGRLLLQFMIGELGRAGRPAHSQIAASNVASLALHRSAGMTLSASPIAWMTET